MLINVRVWPENRDRLQQIADQYELSLSQVARMALAKGLPLLEREFPIKGQ